MEYSKMKPVFLREDILSRNLEAGAQFKIEPEDIDSSFEEDYFDDEGLKDIINKPARKANNDIDFSIESLTPDTTRGHTRKRMTPLTDYGLVLKLEITSGTGIIIPPKSIVLMHYNAYIGNEKQPFDSSYLRANPHKFLLGSGRSVLGLDIAVRSMKKGEISKFIVDSNYAYGEMGCPPQIPPNATITYKIEILSFIESVEEQNKAFYAKTYAVCKPEHQMSKDMVNKKKCSPAIGGVTWFLEDLSISDEGKTNTSPIGRAARFLEDLSIGNEKKDTQLQSIPLKFYVDIAKCCVRHKKSKQAIFYAQKVLAMDENNGEALYYLGRAYLIEKEYDQSRCFLLKAREKYHHKNSVNAQLRKLDKSQGNYAINKEYCKRL